MSSTIPLPMILTSNPKFGISDNTWALSGSRNLFIVAE